MSPALKNRLVGTIIVVAVAVIFLPDLLDGKKESKRDLFVDLPQKPEIKVVKAPAEFDTSKIKETTTRKVEVVSEEPVDENPQEEEASSPVVADVQVPDEHAEKAEAIVEDKTPIESESSLAQQTVVEEQTPIEEKAGWVVQLGSFRHQKNVKELLKKLEKGGYRAFSRPVKTSSGTLTKVFVGPDLDKQKLNQSLSHLKELTNLQGRVTPFTVQ